MLVSNNCTFLFYHFCTFLYWHLHRKCSFKKVEGDKVKTISNKEKTKIVEELKETHRLNILLKILGLSRSSYYYTKTKEDKDKKIKI